MAGVSRIVVTKFVIADYIFWPLQWMVQEKKMYQRRRFDQTLNIQVNEAVKQRVIVRQKQRKDLNCS